MRPSWRTRGLLAAAGLTGLTVEIPKQATPTSEMITAFRSLGSSHVKHPLRGEAYNWLAHLDMIKYINANDYTTSLILEDDVDWDLSIKEQMKLISEAVRIFTHADEDDGEEGIYPYGEKWDILWLGHCGEPTRTETRRISFLDPTMPPLSNLTGWSTKYHEGLQEGYRVIQRAVNPVCSFGFAVTRRGAQKILKWAGKGENEAYDIRLMQGCKEKRLSCVVVNPEVMHHYVPPREFGHISNVAEGNGRASEAEEEEFERIMGNTANLVNSTRCRALFDSTCMRWDGRAWEVWSWMFGRETYVSCHGAKRMCYWKILKKKEKPRTQQWYQQFIYSTSLYYTQQPKNNWPDWGSIPGSCSHNWMNVKDTW